ncbi:metallophosphoesterase family protein [Phyllobacterium sp. K27]
MASKSKQSYELTLHTRSTIQQRFLRGRCQKREGTLAEEFICFTDDAAVNLALSALTGYHVNEPNEFAPTYAIGDVHGCARLLKRLLSAIRKDAEKQGTVPRVIFLGDIIDHGPDSRLAMDQVWQTLEDWPDSRLILGNHDNFLLDFMTADIIDVSRFDAWVARQGGLATLISYGLEDFDSNDAMVEYFGDAYQTHIDLLKSADRIILDRKFAFVHAGIDPSLPIEQQNTRDLMWIREPFLQFQGSLSHIVVHGHTPNKEFGPEIKSNRIGIDTWAVRTGKLSCLAISPDQENLRIIAACDDGSVGIMTEDLALPE